MPPTMKIRVVNSRDEIAKLDPRERVVHLAFPLPAVVLFELMKRCPRLKAIEVPPSRFAKLSKPTRCLLEVQGVKVFPGLLWGHRTDIDEYYTVDEGSAGLVGFIVGSRDHSSAGAKK